MNKIILTLLLISHAFIGYSNMASPLIHGTKSGSVVLSNQVHILSENIYMDIDSNFRTCSYKIEYTIQTDSVNVSLPLAFIALDYLGEFSVKIDDQLLELINTNSVGNNTFSFERHIEEDGYIHFTLNEYSEYGVLEDELKCFNAFLTKNQHTITVEYVAKSWIDLSDWTKEYSFRYSLSPAENWKSFNNLTVYVNTDKDIESNLGKPDNVNEQVYTWQFDTLPNEFLSIHYKSEPKLFPQILIWITPEVLALVFSAFMIMLHVFLINNSTKWRKKLYYFLDVILLSIVLIIIDYIFYLLSYPMLDVVIGNEASEFHGYYFLKIILLPIVLIIHWIKIHFTYMKVKQQM